MNTNIKKMVITALFMALTCIATLIIQIPMPLTNGYINIGDVFVLAAAWSLGSPWGIAAAGIGSALADMIGYVHYVPGTLVIKSLMAVVAILIAKAFTQKSTLTKYMGRIVGGILAEAVMIVGYFLYAWLLLGDSVSAAVTSIPGNAVQGTIGLVLGILLMSALDKTKVLVRLGIKES